MNNIRLSFIILCLLLIIFPMLSCSNQPTVTVTNDEPNPVVTITRTVTKTDLATTTTILNPSVTSPSTTATESEDELVYITKSGTKYHRSTCRYVTDSATAMTLSEAIAKGYEPCSVCNPITTPAITTLTNTPTETVTTTTIQPAITATTATITEPACTACLFPTSKNSDGSIPSISLRLHNGYDDAITIIRVNVQEATKILYDHSYSGEVVQSNGYYGITNPLHGVSYPESQVKNWVVTWDCQKADGSLFSVSGKYQDSEN